MFGLFRKKAPSPKPKKQDTLTEALILQMVAGGMSLDDIQTAFPDMPRKDLQRIVRKGLNRLGMFPEA